MKEAREAGTQPAAHRRQLLRKESLRVRTGWRCRSLEQCLSWKRREGNYLAVWGSGVMDACLFPWR